jgi:hypothetical protein
VKPTVNGIGKIASHERGDRKLKSPFAAATNVAHVTGDSCSTGFRPQLSAATPVGVQKRQLQDPRIRVRKNFSPKSHARVELREIENRKLIQDGHSGTQSGGLRWIP